MLSEMVLRDEKYLKASVLLLHNKVSRVFRGSTMDYFKVCNTDVRVGYDLMTGVDKTGCSCTYEAMKGCKREVSCSHVIACVLFKCLKPMMDKGYIKVLLLKGDEYVEVHLQDAILEEKE